MPSVAVSFSDAKAPARPAPALFTSQLSRPILKLSDSLEYATLEEEHTPTAPPTTGQPYFDLVFIFPKDENDGDVEKVRAKMKSKRLLDISIYSSFEHLEQMAGNTAKWRDVVVARARSIGIEVVIDISRDEDEVLLKLSAPDKLLEKTAERLTMEKRLKRDAQGRLQGYTDFSVAEKERFEPYSSTSFFSSLERIRLLQALIELPRYEGGCGLNLEDLLETKVLTQIVPVHEIEGRDPRLLRRADCDLLRLRRGAHERARLPCRRGRAPLHRLARLV